MKKHSSIMFDDTPTQGSENAITSGGVFNAIQNGGGGGGGGSSYDDTELRNRIGELESDVETLETNIGTLSNLNTTAKTDLVSAINEVLSGAGGSSGTTITKYTVSSNSRSVSYGRVQIDMEGSELVGKTIICAVAKIGNKLSSQYKVISALMDNEFLDVNIINNSANSTDAMYRFSATLNIGFDVYYMR